MKVFFRILIFTFIVFPSLTFSQNIGQESLTKQHYEPKIKSYEELFMTGDSLNTEKPKHLKIGLHLGSHSSNLNQNSSSFDRDVLFEAYLKFSLSNEIHSILAFTYWKAKTTSIGQIPSETITSKGLKLGLDFSLFKIYNVLFSLGPSISFESISIATSTVFSFGTNLKLNLPLWKEKVHLLSIIGYQTGAEILRFNYSFFIYSLGIEISI